MPVEKIDIDQFLQLAKNHPVIDVRSPGEYKHAHIPGAHNIPLFSDEERKIVGTTYKQQSREAAIKIGLDFFGPKMKSIVEEVEGIRNKELGPDSYRDRNLEFGISKEGAANQFPIPNSQFLLLHCWRGGMRSEAIAWLLDLYGFKVYTLRGGYKKFRNYALDTFGLPINFRILGGYTGSGKTELLKVLAARGEKTVDLEKLANHKGSAFGNIGMPPQPTQEMFENLLAIELRKLIQELEESHAPFRPLPRNEGGFGGIWLEDESQRIGLVNIPKELWVSMRRSPLYFLDIPFDIRLKHVVSEYGELDREKLTGAIERISQKLGSLNAKTAILMLEEGRISECFEILLTYYDRFYFKALHNREAIHSLLHTIECKSITSENANQLSSTQAYETEKL